MLSKANLNSALLFIVGPSPVDRNLLRRIFNHLDRAVEPPNIDDVGNDWRDHRAVQEPEVGDDAQPSGLRAPRRWFTGQRCLAQRDDASYHRDIAHPWSLLHRAPGGVGSA